VDTTALVAEFGFEPRSTADAFADFLRGRGEGPLPSDTIRAAENAILAQIRQVRAGIGAGLRAADRVTGGRLGHLAHLPVGNLDHTSDDDSDNDAHHGHRAQDNGPAAGERA